MHCYDEAMDIGLGNIGQQDPRVSVKLPQLPIIDSRNPQRAPSRNMRKSNVGEVAAKPLVRIIQGPSANIPSCRTLPQICLHSKLLLDLRPETIYGGVWFSDGLKVCINKPKIPNLTIIGLPFEGRCIKAGIIFDDMN